LQNQKSYFHFFTSATFANTTGLGLFLHKLIEVLDQLVDAGNTVVIIGHYPYIIKVADHLIDLGPEGGVKRVQA
jgi:excinuclease UvrABC ATPase subunit